MLNKIQKEQIKLGLLQFDLSEKEIEVYLAIIQSNESSVVTISKDTGLSRGTVFDIVEKLEEKGFVAETKKGKKRRLVPESPTNKFYSLLDKKHEDLEKSRKTAEEILPILKSINASEDFKPQIKVYTGEKGFRQVFDDVFSYEGKNWIGVARIETFIKFGGEDFLQEIQDRKVRLGFTSRVINEDSPSARSMKAGDAKFQRETRLAPKEFQFPSTTIVYGDKILMFSTRKENIILMIESKDFAQSHRQYFEMLWKFLEK